MRGLNKKMNDLLNKVMDSIISDADRMKFMKAAIVGDRVNVKYDEVNQKFVFDYIKTEEMFIKSALPDK
jgi:uncharacterized protein with HEPN domain